MQLWRMSRVLAGEKGGDLDSVFRGYPPVDIGRQKPQDRIRHEDAVALFTEGKTAEEVAETLRVTRRTARGYVTKPLPL